MGLPYENSSAGDRAIAEVQKILRKFGCSQFGQMQDYDIGETRIQFKWNDRMVDLRVSWKGYAAAWLKENPWTWRRNGTEKEYKEKAVEKGKMAVCSILRDWIKGQVTAVETGMMTFEEVFMPHMLLPNGKRMVDAARDMLTLPKPDETDV